MSRTVQISVVQPVTLLEDVTRVQSVVMADVNRDGQVCKYMLGLSLIRNIFQSGKFFVLKVN